MLSVGLLALQLWVRASIPGHQLLLELSRTTVHLLLRIGTDEMRFVSLNANAA